MLAVKFLLARFSVQYLSDTSGRKLYKDVSYNLFPVRRYRTLYSAGPRRDVFKSVKRMPGSSVGSKVFLL